jgi:hypothetical protein
MVSHFVMTALSCHVTFKLFVIVEIESLQFHRYIGSMHHPPAVCNQGQHHEALTFKNFTATVAHILLSWKSTLITSHISVG